MGIPRDWHPSVGFEADARVGWAGGYVGDGVAATNLAGRTLADHVLGRRTGLTELPWVQHRSPSWEIEPLRWLGVNVGLQLAGLADREERARQRAIVRQGMLEGDDRYLAPRDRGPVRAYVRDRVDGRFSVGQVMLPVLLTVLVATVVMMYLPEQSSWVRIGVFVAVYGMLLWGLVDGWMLARRLKGEIGRVFPQRAGETKGLTSYVILRSFQMRGSRTPRAAVERGETPRALR